MVFIFFSAVALKIKLKPNTGKIIGVQSRIIVFGIFICGVFTSILSITYFICVISNIFLIYSLSKTNLNTPKLSLLNRIKRLLLISKKDLLDTLVRLFITSCLILIFKLLVFFSFKEIGFILFVYLYIVIYPVASFIRTGVLISFLLKNSILDISLTRVLIII